MRRAAISIDMSQLHTLDAFDIGEALQNLPEDTKIVSFAQSLCEARLVIVIENERFKEVEELAIFPRIYITRDEEERMIIDCSSIMIEEDFHYQASGPYETWYGPVSSKCYNIVRNSFNGIDYSKYMTFSEVNKHYSALTPIQEEINKLHCEHEIKSYEGLTEKYTYCGKCNEKL